MMVPHPYWNHHPYGPTHLYGRHPYDIAAYRGLYGNYNYRPWEFGQYGPWVDHRLAYSVVTNSEQTTDDLSVVKTP